MTRTYTDLKPTFADTGLWTSPKVLRHQASRRPDATFLIAPEEGRQWTYAEMLEAAERVSGGFLAAGASTGDRVLIMAANSSQFIRTWLGSAVAGLVEVPINTAYEGEFLRHQSVTVAPRWAVIDDVFAERFAAIREHVASIEKFWVVDTGRVDTALEILRGNGWAAEPWNAFEEATPKAGEEPAPSDLASIFFTSGTTGPSKGVAMPHAQMYFFGDEVVSLTRLTAEDTYFTCTPLFHGNAQFMAAYPAMIAGARLVVRPKFSASRWIDHLREHDVTVTNLLGVMMDFVWKQPPRDDDRDNRLRAVFAAPTASSILREFKDRFGIEAFVEVFGLTETSAPILSPYGEERPPGAAGLQAADWFDIRLVDPETDEEVPVGEVGELVVRPKHPWTCSMGYYGMPDKTVEAWRNLWFHTGDALRKDADGWFYFVDRYKDALRRRGENISSYEVEQAILQHDAVLECAVIGVAAGIEAGEDEVMAVIVTSRPVDAAEIWSFCEGKIPAFAVPRFIRFVDALPKTPSEKVRKAALREEGVTPATHDRTALGRH
ncbi:ATP-dependent acyl-CoA ligase [Microbispora rosea subsp. aerata]|nr:AMP-binding protein [Microbispora rosea]GGO20656.1 ATP-dependent acyl-CoA ligase [Microbispora rosea subsp. aerata]GIH57110.1 ATP-dependent acyl-CoA ligase [Microbispora rosea subsp. aerata]GLJ84820.1 ATP-dependent acyl-CoA ligase [Microbispora rosea subsp. aerata]